ncbi:flagellar hook protein FlgE [Jeotgalibacillus marinus]|uniref:Flagellar hook protein FlgE n=1 Tax=Jeotgalibacillus marinus TaxID=86667 RepID=A0ABV3Q1S9_9BACL
MIRSMYSGIAGLQNFQTKLDVIGNNIANVNTFGFKKGRVTFQDAMNQTMRGASGATEGRGGTNPLQVGLGSVTASIDNIQTQGSLQTTGGPLDLAIEGDGFFVVQGPGGQNFYTRAGNFTTDHAGNVVTTDGYRVQQFENGVLSDITIDENAVLPARATEQITFGGNFPSDVVDEDFSIPKEMIVVDDSGVEHIYAVEMTPIMPADSGDPVTQWNISFTNNSLDPVVSIDFDIDLEGDFPGTIELPIGEDETFLVSNLNFDGLTNDPGAATFDVDSDGYLEGTLAGYAIGPGGEIIGIYSNDEIQEIATIGLAKFNNPGGLIKVGNNLYQESANSGIANVGEAENIGGVIRQGALEMSNVDISEEFTEMIVTQRGFQANTRIITTSDQILEELVNLKR